MGLPEEIKTMIYGHCLVVNRKIVPYTIAYDHESGIKPFSWSNNDLGISLFAVNKLIREGALNTFYGKNAFELGGERETTALWGRNRRRFRHISIDLGRQDLEPVMSIHIFEHYLRDPSFAGSSQQEIAGKIHSKRMEDLLHSWKLKAMAIGSMKLKSLTIDIKNLDCPEGCCRVVRHVFESVVPPVHHRPHGIFADWHRHDDTIPCNWDHQIYTHPKPERLATMNITVLGKKDEEEAE